MTTDVPSIDVVLFPNFTSWPLRSSRDPSRPVLTTRHFQCVTTKSHSPASLEAQRPPTLGDVRDAVENSADLSAVRIRDLDSAITCFCGLIGQEPDGVPLDLAAIRDKLNAINPVANGISAKRLANIRSDLFAAIAASRLKPVRPPRQSLTEPWRALRAKLKTKRHRIGTSRLSHYASTAGANARRHRRRA